SCSVPTRSPSPRPSVTASGCCGTACSSPRASSTPSGLEPARPTLRSRACISNWRLVAKLLLRHRNALRRRRRSRGRTIVMAAFVALFSAVMVGEYWLFRSALQTFLGLGLAGTALTLYLLETVLVLVFVLALVSFVASGLWTFFRARDTRLFLAA